MQKFAIHENHLIAVLQYDCVHFINITIKCPFYVHEKQEAQQHRGVCRRRWVRNEAALNLEKKNIDTLGYEACS